MLQIIFTIDMTLLWFSRACVCACLFVVFCHRVHLDPEIYVRVHRDMKNFYIIESVDSISRDERVFPLTQYITNGRISRARYTIMHFKHHHRVLRLISYRMSI